MNLIERLFSRQIAAQVRAVLAIREDDATIGVGARTAGLTDRDRYTYDRRAVLEDCLSAWRTNPLARRIVCLTSQYVVGAGISLTCREDAAREFITRIMRHHLNNFQTRVVEWCDELTRTGNLFVLVSTDEAGFSFFRSVPASLVTEINARENDIEQPLSFCVEFQPGEPVTIPAFDPLNPQSGPVMIHYAINRPSGAQWGESDLAPILKWLSRYSSWLEDRARLNRFRNSFLFIVRGNYISEAAKQKRQADLNRIPPTPGTIMVCDTSEEWSVENPQLESQDANEDGLALKKMIAAGAGMPLHFLAEPESSTRTTAEAAGGPTYRHFEQRQEFFLWVLSDLLRAALARAGRDPETEFSLSGADISSRDNLSLSMAVTHAVTALSQLRDRDLITDEELLHLTYRFAGETVDVVEMIRKAKTSEQ